MPEILQLRSPADLRGNIVKGVLTNAGFSVKDEIDLEAGLKLLRSRYREGNPFAGLVVVGTLIFGDCNNGDLLVDIMQLINVAQDNEIGKIAFVSQILHGLGNGGFDNDARVFEDRNGMIEVVKYFQTLGS